MAVADLRAPIRRLAQAAEVKSRAPRGPVLPRIDADRILPHLPDAHTLRIEVNGVIAGAPRTIDDATTEFATGWAFIYRFFTDPDHLKHVVVHDTHVSVMVESGVDLDLARYSAIGWITNDDATDASDPVAVTTTIPELDALASWQTAFDRFNQDGASAGFAHAALATVDDVLCLARDITSHGAIAKAIGWAFGERQDFGATMLVIDGMVDDLTIDTAARAGIPIVASDAVPTAQAMAVAQRNRVSLVGLARSHRRALFVDGGHLGTTSPSDWGDTAGVP